MNSNALKNITANCFKSSFDKVNKVKGNELENESEDSIDFGFEY